MNFIEIQIDYVYFSCYYKYDNKSQVEIFSIGISQGKEIIFSSIFSFVFSFEYCAHTRAKVIVVKSIMRTTIKNIDLLKFTLQRENKNGISRRSIYAKANFQTSLFNTSMIYSSN